MSDERRAAPRIPERVKVRFRTIGGADSSNAVEGETLNMSASGLCLAAPDPLAPETHLAMELSLEGHEQAVMAIGRVVWCDEDGDGYRVGVCFTWLRDEDRGSVEVIAEYVQART